jgi:hypothetical protein
MPDEEDREMQEYYEEKEKKYRDWARQYYDR